VTHIELPKEWRIPKDLSLGNIVEQIENEVSTRNFLNNLFENMSFVSQIELKTISDALKDEN